MPLWSFAVSSLTSETEPQTMPSSPDTPGPAPHKRVWLNGELVPADQASVSIYDHGLLYGDGVFEGMRIYNHRVFKLETHIKRLFDSARAIRLELEYTPEQLAQATRETVKANGRANGYIRLCATRGGGPLGLNPFICLSPSTFIIVDAISMYPEEMYEKGMSIITASTIRNHPAALSPREHELPQQHLGQDRSNRRWRVGGGHAQPSR